MRDWDEGEVRDRLPLLLGGALPPDEAAAMRAHVAADAELADELALLRALRDAHAATPVLDTARIVAALPSPRAVRRTRPAIGAATVLRVQRWARAAAILAVVGVGGLTTWMGRTSVDTSVAAPVAAVASELRLGLPLEELSEEELSALEGEIRSLDGLPSEEPEAGAAHGGLEIGA